MTVLVYQDQSADALRLNLVRGAVDENKLTVLCTGNVDMPYGRVRAGIIGASHFLTFSRPDGQAVFTEVFACTEILSDNRIFYGDLQDASSIKKHFGDMTYVFRARRLGWNQGEKEFDELVNLVQASFDQYQFGLLFSFPATAGFKFPPVTLVYVQTNPEKMMVKVRTLHAYPNEGALVFTETNLQPK